MFMRAGLGRVLAVLVFLMLGFASAGALEGTLFVHDPSPVVKCDGRYYVFGTGRGIPILASEDRFTWQREGKVFDRVPESVHAAVPKNDGQDVWAPQVIALNGEYYLYYSISSWGQFVSAVGLMTSPTLNAKDPRYKWTDRGPVVHSAEGENLNAIDPGVVQGPDGRLWISYGSYHGNIELVELNRKTGLRIAPKSKVTVIANHSEASQIMYHGGYYYLMVNHGSCCQGPKSTYTIRMGRAKAPTGPYLDRDGVNMADGGGTLFLGSGDKMVGPGQFGRLEEDGVEKFSCHFEGTVEKGGRGGLAIRPLLWTVDGWPKAGVDVAGGVYQVRSVRTGMVLEVPAAADGATGPVAAGTVETGVPRLGDYVIRDGQQWDVAPAGGGFYKVVSGQESRAANALGLGADGKLGVGLFTGAPGQLWKIDELADGSYRIEAKAGGMVLAVAAGDPMQAVVPYEPGHYKAVEMQAFIRTGGTAGSAAQKWELAAP